MKSVVLLLFPAILILVSAFSGNKFNETFYSHPPLKKIGIFDRDSVLNTLPEYHKALDSIDHYKKQLDTVLVEINIELSEKQKEFNTDSTKWSDLVKQVKRYELIDLQSRIETFKQMAGDELENKKQNLILPLNENVNFAANDLAKKRKFDTVFDKTDSAGYRKLYPQSKITNVTKQIHVLVGNQYRLRGTSSVPEKPAPHIFK